MSTTQKAEAGKESEDVLEEVWRTKVKLAERFNCDIDAMVRDARKRQWTSGHEVVDRSVPVEVR